MCFGTVHGDSAEVMRWASLPHDLVPVDPSTSTSLFLFQDCAHNVNKLLHLHEPALHAVLVARVLALDKVIVMELLDA